MKFHFQMQALTVAGLSNLISTLLVILLQGAKSWHGFLLVQSLFSTFVMVINLNIFKIFKSYLYGWSNKKDQDNWIKERLNSHFHHM